MSDYFYSLGMILQREHCALIAGAIANENNA